MKAGSFLSIVKSPFKFRMFLLSKLPAAFFSGLRLREITDKTCTITVPYKWFTKNPFRSTYFASLAMGAELTTGILSMKAVIEKNKPFSFLVTGLEASYFKKAIGKTIFTCNDGESISNIIAEAITTKEGRQFQATSLGVNEAGEKIAEFKITWSYKAKQG